VHRALSAVYHSSCFSIFIFAMIALNFVLNVLDFEFQPDEQSDMKQFLNDMDTGEKLSDPQYEERERFRADVYSNTVFTILFTFEVSLNAIVNWFMPFWRDVWNWFDAGVMAISIYGLTSSNSSISWLRIFRVLRVVRIVRRLNSLRTIMNSLMHASLPVHTRKHTHTHAHTHSHSHSHSHSPHTHARVHTYSLSHTHSLIHSLSHTHTGAKRLRNCVAGVGAFRCRGRAALRRR
jgi:hypothetical protein